MSRSPEVPDGDIPDREIPDRAGFTGAAAIAPAGAGWVKGRAATTGGLAQKI